MATTIIRSIPWWLIVLLFNVVVVVVSESVAASSPPPWMDVGGCEDAPKLFHEGCKEYFQVYTSGKPDAGCCNSLDAGMSKSCLCKMVLQLNLPESPQFDPDGMILLNLVKNCRFPIDCQATLHLPPNSPDVDIFASLNQSAPPTASIEFDMEVQPPMYDIGKGTSSANNLYKWATTIMIFMGAMAIWMSA